MRLGKGTWSRAKVQSKGIQLPAPFQEQETEEALDSNQNSAQQVSREPSATELNTHYKLTIDFF